MKLPLRGLGLLLALALLVWLLAFLAAWFGLM